MNPEILAVIANAVIALVQSAPAIAADVEALLAPILQNRAPTDAEWTAAQAALDTANQNVQGG
jgi:hypothetical protein